MIKIFHLIPFKKQLIVLAFSCLFSLAFIEFRIFYFKNKYNHFLVWNLFLALVPLLIAYVSFIYYKVRRKIDLVLIIFLLIWLLFFPNAPYIVSDFIHLKPKKGIPIWYDICLFYSFSWNGMLSGIMSLRLIQILISDRFNKLIGWLIVLAIAPLASFGIYLGRFYRWNSWDIVNDPVHIIYESLKILGNVYNDIKISSFLLIVSLGILVAYAFVISLGSLNLNSKKEEI
ncbi:DUF1361 domain-containing protein [Leptospira sp. GIMC2001]|uniref:DUF1361 domain-containing protein n=1 Tax=Leptospira sp. GIMC2001 TaxID=1513297 RepID=UPI0023494925|nr:DUF1361 domain-containing protein [Leptospira sp. GIMC2001]WCL50673.1 DUF1361 domain-containing protein [Leptospira sp. GIMC2001]